METQREYWENYFILHKDTETLSVYDPSRITGKVYVDTLNTLFGHYDGDINDAVVLEYGAGTGRLAKALAGRCKLLYLLDISELALEECRRRFKEHANVGYILGDNGKLSFESGSVDFTYSYAALCYCDDARTYWKNIKEIDRISKNFCIQMHRNFNCDPNPERGTSKGFDLYEAEFYRPTLEITKKMFPADNYFIEAAAPDLRGMEYFFYKVDPASK